MDYVLFIHRARSYFVKMRETIDSESEFVLLYIQKEKCVVLRSV